MRKKHSIKDVNYQGIPNDGEKRKVLLVVWHSNLHTHEHCAHTHDNMGTVTSYVTTEVSQPVPIRVASSLTEGGLS